jgi:hypothetical protein
MIAVRASVARQAATPAARGAVSSKRFNPLAAHLRARRPAGPAARGRALTVRANTGAKDPDAPVDIWRDTPVRYMGQGGFHSSTSQLHLSRLCR